MGLDAKIEISREEMSTKRSEPRREDRDEYTIRVSEESLEMSQMSELATGVRGSDSRSRREQAGQTPPIPPTGRSARGRNGRVVPADHEGRSHKSQTCTCDT